MKAQSATKFANLVTAGCLTALGSAAAIADPISETLFFTNFSSHQIQDTIGTYTGNGTSGNGTFTLTTPHVITTTPGADGIVRNPNNGQLLIGGQGNAVYQVNPSTGTFTSATPSVAAFHLEVDPSKNIVWASAIPGNLSSLPINPFGGAGTVLTLTGSNTAITSLAFTPGGTVFYTAAGAGGVGNFGTINLTTGVTSALISNLPAAHGMVFDPFSGDLILGGSNHITQIDPLNPTVILSDLTVLGNTFDQGAVDGLGHIFWADNGGRFFFEDYSTTGLAGSASNFVSDNFFQSNLDDIAPLIGAGGTGNVPEPATLALLGVALAGMGFARRRRLN